MSEVTQDGLDELGPVNSQREEPVVESAKEKEDEIEEDVGPDKSSSNINNKCSSCDKGFPTGYGLRRHVESVHLKLRRPKRTENICEACGKDFSTKFALKTHTNSVHLKIRNFPCVFCDYRGSDRTSLERHVNAYHIEFGSLLCDICGKKFYERFKLERHKKVHAEPEEICEQCGMVFRLKANLKKHVEAVHLKRWKVLKCSLCDYTARKRCYLNQHVSRYHKGAAEEQFPCSICGCKMHSSRKLLEHYQQVHRSSGEPSIKAEPAIFITTATAERLKKEPEVSLAETRRPRRKRTKETFSSHSGKRNDVTEVDSQDPSYVERTELKLEEASEVEGVEDDDQLIEAEENLFDFDDPEADYIELAIGEEREEEQEDEDLMLRELDVKPNSAACEDAVISMSIEAYAVFKKEAEDIQESDKSHSKDSKRVDCDKCGNVFVDKYALKNHVEAVHFKLKKYSCTLCDFRTASKSTLTRHCQCVHSKSSSHLCDTCGKSFNAPHKLKRHYVIHNAPKEMCHTCGKAFKIKAELKRHVDDIHLKVEKTKRCDICDYASSRNFHLKRHMEMVHQGLKRFSCHLCGKTMSLKCNLDKHIKTVHEKKVDS